MRLLLVPENNIKHALMHRSFIIFYLLANYTYNK